MEKRLLIFFSLLSITGDLFILNFLLLLFCLKDNFQNIDTYWFWISLLMNVVWIVLALSLGINSQPRIKQRKKIVRDVLIACLVLFFLLLFGNLLFRKEFIFTSGFLKLILITPFLIIIWKLFLDSLAHFLRKHGFNPLNVLIIGYNTKIEELKDYFINNLWSGYHFKGFIHDHKDVAGDIIGDYEELEQIIKREKINELFLNLSEIPGNYRSSIITLAYDMHLGIKLIPDLGDFPAFYHNYQRYDLMPVLAVSKGPFSDSLNFMLKRVFDLIFSFIIIVTLLSWLSPLFAVIIKLTSRGPIFFRQKRTGYHNKTFTCMKFRTMVQNTDADRVQATENDLRITKIGRFLRRTSLDELPQFLNVIVGQMSIVGPRPHMIHHTKEYSGQIPHYLHRHYFRPGITGLAQVRGWRGETKDLDLMKARIEQDIYYIENWSLWLDIKIIFITVGNLFSGERIAY
jgi:putative colanic acid biosysnthesis UDP-glucose lipid carrier transferase